MSEELKMVLETISQLGAAGKDAFIWWLVITYGTKLLTGLMVLAAALGLPYVIIKAIARQNEKGKVLELIGKRLGVDYYYWAEYCPPGHTLNDVLEAFDKRVKEQK